MAVLYRSHSTRLGTATGTHAPQHPFSITSGIRFFEQAHIKDVTAYVKFITNPRDELALKRMVRLLDGVGGKTADRIWNAFKKRPDRRWRGAAKNFHHSSKKIRGGLAQFTATIAQLEDPEIRPQPGACHPARSGSGYEGLFAGGICQLPLRREDIEQLAGFSRQFESVEDS